METRQLVRAFLLVVS